MPPIFPTVNASLNLLATIFLLLGYLSIKQKKQIQHKYFMLAALAASGLFLVCYITYHYLVPGVTKYHREGFLRYLYLSILISHTILATGIVPFVIAAVYHAYKKQFEKHKRITRILWPIWMYVSSTGVIIYLMLYVF